MIELMESQLRFADVSAIQVRGKWYEVHDVTYFALIQMGHIEPSRAYGDRSFEECFWGDADLKGWVRVETAENETIYFSINAITGFKLDGPSGG